VPIVFVTVVDPVSSGFVDSLARPGGNITGFSLYEYSISGKWLGLLKEIAPGITRAAVIRDPALTAGGGQLGVIQAVAPLVGAEVIPVNVRDAGEIERAITAFARSPNGGLIVTGSTLAAIHRDLIVTLAARHKLPAVYFQRYFVVGGGLISYGSGLVDQYRDAAGYVDRILKGEKPADLPVQAPTKYELVINLKTAKTRPSHDSTLVTPHNAPFSTYKEARVHLTSWQRGGLAARGARAAVGADAPDFRVDGDCE